MPPRATISECQCGAAYERREVTLPIKDIGFFECAECGARLEIWSGRNVPVFKQIQARRREIKSA